MKRFFPFFVIALILCACSSNKSKVANHMKECHPDFVLADGEATEDKGFCPYEALKATCTELENCRNQLQNTIFLDENSAVALAKQYKEKYANVSALLSPTGNNDRKTITMKCVAADNEDDVRHVVFYMLKDEDEVECCSLDFIAYEDDIMNKQRKLMELVESVLSSETNNAAKTQIENTEKAEKTEDAEKVEETEKAEKTEDIVENTEEKQAQ